MEHGSYFVCVVRTSFSLVRPRNVLRCYHDILVLLIFAVQFKKVLLKSSCVLYSMLISVTISYLYSLSGTDPFSSSSVSLEQQIKEADYSFPLHVWKTISSSAKNLIHRMLTNDPEERITIPEVIEDHWLQVSL